MLLRSLLILHLAVWACVSLRWRERQGADHHQRLFTESPQRELDGVDPPAGVCAAGQLATQLCVAASDRRALLTPRTFYGRPELNWFLEKMYSTGKGTPQHCCTLAGMRVREQLQSINFQNRGRRPGTVIDHGMT